MKILLFHSYFKIKGWLHVKRYFESFSENFIKPNYIFFDSLQFWENELNFKIIKE